MRRGNEALEGTCQVTRRERHVVNIRRLAEGVVLEARDRCAVAEHASRIVSCELGLWVPWIHTPLLTLPCFVNFRVAPRVFMLCRYCADGMRMQVTLRPGSLGLTKSCDTLSMVPFITART